MSMRNAWCSAAALAGSACVGAASPAPEVTLDITLSPAVVRVGDAIHLSWRIGNTGRRTLAMFSHVETEVGPHYDALTLVLTPPRGGATREVALSAGRKSAAIVRCSLGPGQSMTRTADVSTWLKDASVPGHYGVIARLALEDAGPVERLAPCNDASAVPVNAEPWTGTVSSRPVALTVSD